MNSVCTYPGSYSELIIRRRQKPELSLWAIGPSFFPDNRLRFSITPQLRCGSQELSLAISRSLSIDGLAPCFFSN